MYFDPLISLLKSGIKNIIELSIQENISNCITYNIGIDVLFAFPGIKKRKTIQQITLPVEKREFKVKGITMHKYEHHLMT